MMIDVQVVEAVLRAPLPGDPVTHDIREARGFIADRYRKHRAAGLDEDDAIRASRQDWLESYLSEYPVAFPESVTT